jgi:hypothetical protein
MTPLTPDEVDLRDDLGFTAETLDNTAAWLRARGGGCVGIHKAVCRPHMVEAAYHLAMAARSVREAAEAFGTKAHQSIEVSNRATWSPPEYEDD